MKPYESPTPYVTIGTYPYPFSYTYYIYMMESNITYNIGGSHKHLPYYYFYINYTT
ncbi:hypothetical protein J5U23_01494 [Saccharolobus shibatae B12]|uniref:Uncharacterized protein n=2 Tax=Saccharolobus shibatae TaxID=2286 RepID=A0A8F5BNM6_SACSH|nr:hypothetical protein [Saccharolobus shibatae]QXJ28625.1 hypothetical protein J5U23_01494 [Saccharolobus shibatae B12]QXJ32003.1 hypothetical protein J5U21_01654 [Saccharolobus shibatae]